MCPQRRLELLPPREHAVGQELTLYRGHEVRADPHDGDLPETVVVHGDSDEMLPAVLTQRAAQTLEANGVEVGVHIAPGIGHGIDQTGLSHAARFVLEAFKLSVPSQ